MQAELPETDLIAFEDAPLDLDLSRWTGAPADSANDTPDLGDVRAERVANLRRIRDERLYTDLTSTWEEFCEKHLRITRRSVDRNIRRLKEFGPLFFRVAEAVPLSSQEYRLIRGHVCPDGVRLDGALIPFDDAFSDELSDAVTELLRRGGSKPAKARGESFSRVIAQLEIAAKALDRYDRTLDRLQKFELSALLGRAARRAMELGVRPA
jgi:hypothetical protein